MPSHTSGVRLVFFLYMLIPGYFAFRSYLWANIALDDTSRLTKLVHMSIGGFGSLAGVSILRELQVVHFGFVPTWMSITQEISITTISALSLPKATNLILLQSALATIGGILIGSLRIILFDGETKERKNLNDPWEELEYQTAYNQQLTVITQSGERITGKLYEIGNSSDQNDLLLTNPVKSYYDTDGGTTCEDDEIGEMSYHHQRDISRILLHQEWEGYDRSTLEEKHRDVLSVGLWARNWVLRILGILKVVVIWLVGLLKQLCNAIWSRDQTQNKPDDAYDIDSTISIEQEETDDEQE